MLLHTVGVARINLSALNFDHSLRHNHRELSDKVVERLRKIFTTEGCLRLDDENHISAVVDSGVLATALSVAGLGMESLRRGDDGFIPHLIISSVKCLHGLHRIAAAKAHLDDNDQWWAVRLYSDGIT